MPAQSPEFYEPPQFDTLQLHAGQVPDQENGSRAPAIYSTAAYAFKSCDDAARKFGGQEPGHVYSRISNPTLDVFEARMAALEGGVGALAVSSGLTAQFMAIANIATTGDNIVSSTYLFGGSYNQFKVTLPKFGIKVKFVTGDNPDDYATAIDERTRAIFVEAIGNPKYDVAPIPELAKVAHDHNIPLIVGYYLRPFDYGADIITHSATKWIGGHGTVIAGVVVDSGNFDWAASGKFPAFTQHAPGYGETIYVKKFGKKAYMAKLRMELMRDIGMTLNPFGGWLLIQGLETLSLRAQRHSDNALELARWLQVHPQVAWVSFLGLPSHIHHERAKQLFRKNTWGSVLSFGVKGGMEVGKRVVDSLKLCSNLANVGDAKTLVIHPATTTHVQLTPEEQLSAGVTPDLIRVSVGIEDITDIIVDFQYAFRIATDEGN
ncbi:O-acetylhomoserine ami [Pluteus cervinus]|uniref:O-acetylhomoserine ami n=1 Tax=Pluteus cervinus TaxID=181527 RepID=A0ACD3ARE5_9AGAR|nr:O-acetylhomoserine ami [Pluteus cervinus]